jgi:molybdenum cofactor cytidylyltransferase
MGQDKLNLPLGSGLSLLEQSALHLSSTPHLSQHVIVVRDRTRLAFDPETLGFTVLEIGNQASLGMHRSLKLGLSQIHPQTDAVMVCLGDQPFVRPSDFSLLLHAYVSSLREGCDLLYPTENGRRGNPAVIHRRYFEEILSEPDSDQGCRYLFERHPTKVRAWPASSPAFFVDLDTPEDYRACLN